MTAIILAGGKSTRINTNKIFLPFANKTMLERRINLLAKIFKNIIVVVNSKMREKEIEPIVNSFKNKDLHLKVVCDYIKDKGSIGGLYSGLMYSKTLYNFVTACDMPFLNVQLLEYMKKFTKDKKYDAIIPFFQKGYEPLFAFYSKNCIKPIEKQLEKTNLKITNFFAKIIKKNISLREIKQFDTQLLSFFNINTLDNYSKAKQIYLKNSKL
ncbi:MAG: molybdenum cofactor guanylyltransferase [Candidatus Firestonebacteria bacterium]